MAVGAIIKDGELVESISQSSVKEASSTPAGYDKDAFLQLLVAQMKYQDPLEPTSNTEYISQYATFSQVEQLQNMASSMDLSRASSYVGQTVEISTTDSKGEAQILQGVVDFVKYENNKAYVSISGELYPAENITAVIDQTYSTAAGLAESFAKAVNELPTLANLTLADEEAINSLREGYNALSAYQQSFIDKSYVEKLEEYVTRIAQMKEDAAKSEESTEDNNTEDESEDTETVEEA